MVAPEERPPLGCHKHLPKHGRCGLEGLADHGPAILDRQVADLMTRPVHSCSLDDSVKHLMSEMTRKRIRHLPVIDNGVLCGIVSIGDVVKNRLDEVEMEANVLRDAYIARA